jgi:glyoxylase-like metal-dependent hydrolase (beta-lactamase superfamily II)
MKIMDDVFLVGSGQFAVSTALDCHIYLIRDGSDYILIDTGAGKFKPDTDVIVENIKKEGIDTNSEFKLFLTHAHSDHAGGGKFLKEKLDCTIFANELTAGFVGRGREDELGLDYAKRSGFYGDDYKFRTYKVDKIVKDGQIIKIGNLKIKCILTPGHSTDSMCYLVEKDGKKMLFTGDVVNHGGKFIILNCAGFSLQDYRENIKKLKKLSVDMLFPGHGVFTLENGQSHIDILIDASDKLLINQVLVI